jgi:hypothetical protein
MQNAHRIWYENPKTRDHFEDRRKMWLNWLGGRE